MTDLPAEVRDRAARAAQQARWSLSELVDEPAAPVWRAVVDAVAEVLAEQQAKDCGCWDRHAAEAVELRADRDRCERENRKLREALGIARTEYGGKSVEDLDEYDRLRLTANAFQVMYGVEKRSAERRRVERDEALTMLRELVDCYQVQLEALEPDEWTLSQVFRRARALVERAGQAGAHPAESED